MTDDIKAIRDALQEPWAEPDRSADAEVQRLYRLCQTADDAIARLLDALEAAQRREEVLRFERDIARARAEQTAKLLGGVHALLYPPRVQMEDGRAFEFRPPDPHTFMQGLSDRIRALPDQLAAVESSAPQSPPADRAAGASVSNPQR